MNNNFTLSNNWCNAIPIRYDINSIININNLYFIKEDKSLKCQHYFDFEISSKVLAKLENMIENGCLIKFNYIDDGVCLKILKKWTKEHGFILDIVDQWDAPCLNINDINTYLKSNTTNQVKKNYKKYKDTISDYDYVLSNPSNVLKLWNDVLYIDYNSWKKENNCDMKSLSREDLQYIFFLINEPTNSSLDVCYKNGIPFAYSLLFRANSKSKWYAVKWGASKTGREKYLGIFCLFNHLLEISSNNMIDIDFWGRRSRVYDYLKNNHIRRSHIEIRKEV